MMHAEMSALRFSKPGDVLFVLRWTKDGQLTMSKPCERCQQMINSAGLKKVFYTNWNGEFERF